MSWPLAISMPRCTQLFSSVGLSERRSESAKDRAEYVADETFKQIGLALPIPAQDDIDVGTEPVQNLSLIGLEVGDGDAFHPTRYRYNRYYR